MEGLVLLNFIHSLLLPLLLQLSASNARDTITPSDPLKDNQTLVSPGQTFELGFFSPNNSGKYRYLGIWYKLPIQTVIWVANRDNPLSDSSGFLKINSNGNLVLVNQASAIIWSSLFNHSKVENPIAQLLDTGNLVVKSESKEDEPNKDYIWQSFDYPIDNLIAGMKLGWDLKTGFNRKMNSWKSFENPSPGDFTYEMDLHQGAQLVLRNRSTELFQSGPWNGARFSGTPEMRNNSVFVPILVNNDEGLYYTFKAAGAVISRLSINPSGLIQRHTWSNKSLQWTVIFTAQIDKCTSYGVCGVNGVCNINDIIVCKCMKGFEPKSPEDWSKIEWSSGCKRSIPLNCDSGDGFVKFASVKLPDTTNSWVDRSMRTLEECEMKCVENCSCTAYANSDIVDGGSGCILWFGDLIDIRTFNHGGQELYVKMAASELDGNGDSNQKNNRGTFTDGNGDSNQKKNRGALIASVSVILGMLTLSSAVGFIIWRARRRTGKECNGEKSQNESDLDLPLVDFDTIATATGHFSSTNEIGQGGFGLVYKGELSSGQEIAVKRLSKNSKQGLDEFKNEVILIAKLQHRNLVKLLGCCIQGEEMMLIYEYMPNKSLDQFIFDQEGSTLICWQKRFHIINGVAQGVLYLHRDSRLRIIHRDLKASNVLLDNEMNAKISDFGLARTFGGDQTLAQTRRIVGTYGYLSPEYAVHGQFSIKSDVFSFGVLVLEIITGKRNRGFYHPDHDLNLLGHAWKLWNEGRPLELVDKVMEYTISKYEALRCIEVGLLCVQHHPEDRPTMSSVILMLGSDAILPQPKQPGFYHETSSKDGQSLSEKFYYDNKITITTIDGR